MKVVLQWLPILLHFMFHISSAIICAYRGFIQCESSEASRCRYSVKFQSDFVLPRFAFRAYAHRTTCCILYNKLANMCSISVVRRSFMELDDLLFRESLYRVIQRYRSTEQGVIEGDLKNICAINTCPTSLYFSVTKLQNYRFQGVDK